MMPPVITNQAPVLPLAYHRLQARRGANLHIDALTLVTNLHLYYLRPRISRLDAAYWGLCLRSVAGRPLFVRLL